MSLTDRVAIVTGGSSGIGRGIATRLASDGVRVTIADPRRKPKQGTYFDTDAETPTDELIEESHDSESLYVQTDVSRERDVERMVTRTLDVFGEVDFLVNNAGIDIPGDSQSLETEDWKRVIDVNLTGQFLSAKHTIPHLVESDQGRIINISSVYACFGGAGPPYSATKAGIANMTRDLAAEVADEEVTVNAVLPGFIKTPLQDHNDKEDLARGRRRTLLQRAGTPEDVAHAVRFFVSEDASWITGAQLLVDGGYAATP